MTSGVGTNMTVLDTETTGGTTTKGKKPSTLQQEEKKANDREHPGRGRPHRNSHRKYITESSMSVAARLLRWNDLKILLRVRRPRKLLSYIHCSLGTRQFSYLLEMDSGQPALPWAKVRQLVNAATAASPPTNDPPQGTTQTTVTKVDKGKAKVTEEIQAPARTTGRRLHGIVIGEQTTSACLTHPGSSTEDRRANPVLLQRIQRLTSTRPDGDVTKTTEETVKFLLPRLFSSKKGTQDSFSSVEFGGDSPPSPISMRSFSGMDYCEYPPPLANTAETQAFRIFVATWNVGGKPPHKGLNLNDFLPSDDQSDIYVLGFQEIVPLNAGNVLVIEDNEPAAKWLGLINQALNKSPAHNNSNSLSSLLFFHKPSLKTVIKSFRTVPGRQLKSCNCTSSETERKYYRDSCFGCQQAQLRREEYSSEDEAEESNSFIISDIHQKFCLVACKQMVGIFVTVWVRRELAQYVSHLRISCVGRGIMGYLGNKGCISVSMSLHQTSFCFVCSHLASGEKEGDELRRNSDVIEILKNTQFRRVCRDSLISRVADKILGHDRIIWLGDLNYRIALSYSETKKLLQDNAWDALFEKDQLKMEREAGRVFKGWKEGKIYFAPTYKYSDNSDAYAGEVATSKKKRRTPAWCDRILWHGDGIVQLSYIRGESRFSDHRPVCAVFLVEVEVLDGRLRKDLSTQCMNVGVEELLSASWN
ncbi:hypothetical protein J5N97_017912 [Dioscorea zingiberensis]|uniref:Inositol polyphosphate-related phosphatase domain-containing protein n=1 Tax=Dioscorea zingiberensis TaxID=325984 RepID=A0A9D5HH53_9LILI|nr:hypothetical protein J5N97_017912 [Dioscorea zingiberensis]